MDCKRWRNLIEGGKGDNGKGSTESERIVFLFDLALASAHPGCLGNGRPTEQVRWFFVVVLILCFKLYNLH